MTTTNVYQGLSGEKQSSRVLSAPGGGSSNIFGHYQDESNRERAAQHQQETNAVIQSVSKGANANGDVAHTFNDNRDSFNTNRQRNQGDGAPFAVSDSMVSTGRADRPAHQQQVIGADYQTPQEAQAANRHRNQGDGAPFAVNDNLMSTGRADRPAHQQQVIGADYQTPREAQAANRNRNLGSGAPFATGDPQPPPQTERVYHAGQTSTDDYVTPQQRQANNPNKAGNSFSNLFGDSGADSQHAKAAGKVSTHNPVTWEAYSNFDAAQDHPQHRSRFENFASTKAGTFNPITGEDHAGNQPSTRVNAPPGGKSSIQF